MRLATFNIRHGESREGRVARRLLARTCDGLDVDVLALQEVDKWMRRSGWRNLAASVACHAGMAHAFGASLRKGWFGSYGNAILVRGRLSAIEVLSLPTMGEPRSALLATAELQDGRISVAVTHLSLDEQERGRQLEIVLGALATRPSPHVLCGDLNAPPEEVGAAVGRAGFQLVVAGPTFPAHAPKKQIDHVAFSGLGVGRAWVEETPVSDHRPLLVEMSPEP